MSDAATRGTFEVLGDLMHEIRAAENDLRIAQDAALRRYVERVDAVLAFGIPIEEHADDDDHNPLHVLDALRVRLDKLRVQAHLGAMDGEEIVRRVHGALRRLGT